MKILDYAGREITEGAWVCVSGGSSRGTMYGATILKITIKPARKYDYQTKTYLPSEKAVITMKLDSGRRQTLDASNLASRCVVVEKP